MSMLKIFMENNATAEETLTAPAAIATRLDEIGVRYEQWRANQPLENDAADDEIIAAYGDSVDRLMQAYDFKSVDVVALGPDHPDKAALRAKFLDEHTHSDFEVRFFVDGKGLFYIHAGDRVFGLMCEKGDLISVPGDTPHWFDMGGAPNFKCIRLFTTPEGWVASYTGSDIAKGFPGFEDFQ